MFKIILFLLCLVFSFSINAQKKIKKLSPYQDKINQCFNGQIDVLELADNKKLYMEIVKKFPLQASESNYREVFFLQAGEKRKLQFEDGIVQIYKIDADEKVQLLSTENMNESSKSNGMRYKLKTVESKMAQILNRVDIKSDFIKTTEYRAKQVVLNIAWADGQIKTLSAQIGSEKRKLECQKKDLADICDCK